MYQIQGAGGVGVGTGNPLGQQFGAYAKLIIDQVGRKWNTATLDPRLQTAPIAAISFTINHDGSVATNSIRISQSSGNPGGGHFGAARGDGCRALSAVACRIPPKRCANRVAI